MPRIATLVIEHPAWYKRASSLRRLVSKSCWAACTHEQLLDNISLTIVCTTDTVVYGLNHQFRGKSAPTNVLSFPDGAAGEDDERYLGDIVISMDTLAEEAAAQDKNIEDHFCHLLVHSVLHLLGYDHESDAEADVMEAKEITILQKLGINNPYL